MKSFRRWLMRGLTSLSLLLCAAAIVLWVRSYLIFDDAVLVRPKSTTNIVSLYGRIYLQFGWSSSAFRASGRYAVGGWFLDSLSASPTRYSEQSSRLNLLGFDARNWRGIDATGQITRGERTVVIPYWFLALLTVLLPALALRRMRRKRRDLLRLELRLCSQCGYDLRATPDRCPECGTIPQPW